MSPDEIRRAIEDVEWFHSIELGHGIVTPGVKGKREGRTGREWMQIERKLLQLPPVTGKSVLDIGTRDGFYAFEAERGGARRVTTIDDWDATRVDRSGLPAGEADPGLGRRRQEPVAV